MVTFWSNFCKKNKKWWDFSLMKKRHWVFTVQMSFGSMGCPSQDPRRTSRDSPGTPKGPPGAPQRPPRLTKRPNSLMHPSETPRSGLRNDQIPLCILWKHFENTSIRLTKRPNSVIHPSKTPRSGLQSDQILWYFRRKHPDQANTTTKSFNTSFENTSIRLTKRPNSTLGECQVRPDRFPCAPWEHWPCLLLFVVSLFVITLGYLKHGTPRSGLQNDQIPTLDSARHAPIDSLARLENIHDRNSDRNCDQIKWFKLWIRATSRSDQLWRLIHLLCACLCTGTH